MREARKDQEPRECACGEKLVGVEDIRIKICPTCRDIGAGKVASYQLALRLCHDGCGRQTPDYRCPDCWAKWREKYGVRDEVDYAYEI